MKEVGKRWNEKRKKNEKAVLSQGNRAMPQSSCLAILQMTHGSVIVNFLFCWRVFEFESDVRK